MKKNIVMILTDQMHKYALGTFDKNIKTPNLDRLSQESLCFENAYSNNPVCSPYRGCLFTGMYSCDNGVLDNNQAINDGIECMADRFNNSGYETSFVGKLHLEASGNKPIPKHLQYGFKHFMGYQCYNSFVDDVVFYDEDGNAHEFDDHRTDMTTKLGIDRMGMLADTDKSFLHIIFYQAPHYPEQPSDEFISLYKDEEVAYPPNYESIDPFIPTYSPPNIRPFEKCPNYIAYGNDMQAYKRMYNGMVSQIDKGVGRILSEIKELGIEDETLVLFSSDHGDLQGAHGLKGKREPYEESCGVPLIIKNPEVMEHKAIKKPVSGIDIYPTALAFAGIDIPGSLEGENVLEFDDNDKKPRHVFSENHIPNDNKKWVMIRDERYKMTVKMATGKPYLMFDMDSDPYEMNNIVDSTSYDAIKQRLLNELRIWNKNRDNPPINF